MDVSSNQYFFEQHMNPMVQNAYTLAYFGSAESILAGHHLHWFDHNQVVYDFETNGYYIENWKELWSPDRMFYYGTLYTGTSSLLYMRQFEIDAINQQLGLFRNAFNTLNDTEGLAFYITVEARHILDEGFGVSIMDESSGMIIGNYEIHEHSGRVTFEDFEQHRFTTHFVTITYTNYEGYLPIYNDWKSFSVFYINTGGYIEQSNNTNYYISYGYEIHGDNWAIYLAFDYSTVSKQNNFYSAVRSAYTTDFIIIAVSALIILGLIVVLLVGAGRKYILVDGKQERKEGVHFSPVDRPYWDISLAVLILWAVFILFTGNRIFDEITRFSFQSISWHSRTILIMNIVFAVIVLLVVPFFLIWLTGLTKRIKAGGFWKHTLVYAIVYHCLFGFLRFLARKAKALWTGTRPALRVFLISAAAFCVIFFTGLVGAVTGNGGLIIVVSIISTTVITIFLLLYARRIRCLESGARAVSEGDYEAQIDAGGGELGSIANSINCISAGINTAVEQRMKSERLKTELITNVSHDIRTPLTSIITYTDLLDHEGLDNEKAPEYLEILKQKSLRLKTLTDELFEAAKAATGNIDVNLTELNVASLMNQVLGELDNAVKSSGLDLRVNLPEKLYARADGRLMQRIMENLLSNVFKYSMPGSRVYLDAYAAEPSQVRIEIKNISSQELNFDPSELTERFKRGDDSRADGGSGLGLSIVQSFTGAQGGTFDISIDGDLFKATVQLPAAHIPPLPPQV